MNQYYIYRREHGLSAAEQRAADQRIGELAEALADVRSAVAQSLRRRLGFLRPWAGRTVRAKRRAWLPPADTEEVVTLQYLQVYAVGRQAGRGTEPRGLPCGLGRPDHRPPRQLVREARALAEGCTTANVLEVRPF